MTGARHEHDFASPGVPSRFYAICTTPRSGSSMLARILWRTGLMGAPSEYFSLDNDIFELQKHFMCAGIGEYTDEILKRRTSPNGVFGTKLFFPHWNTFRHCRRIERFVPMSFIHLVRRDRIAQAVSHRLAMQTGRWWSTHAPRAKPKYEFRALLTSLREIEFQHKGWNKLLATLKAPILHVIYEDLCADVEGHVRSIMVHVGVDPAEPAAPVAVEAAERQSSLINQEWTERFRVDLARWREQRQRGGAATP